MPFVRGRRVSRNFKRTRAINPNAGIAAAYRQHMRKLIERMHDSVMYWVCAAYKANEPEQLLAMDVLPASAMRRAMAKLAVRWRRQFNDMAPKLARYFARSVEDRSTAALRKILKDGGITVDFKMTAGMRDVFRATVNENVALIKSIPQQYLTNVETLVMRSVASGRDLQQLTRDLQKQYGVTRRRAELIARDQNNKATSALTHARQRELGVARSVWRHSGAGKEPRPAHVKMDGKTYDINKGMWDSTEGRFVFPGELINCRCTGSPILPGLG